MDIGLRVLAGFGFIGCAVTVPALAAAQTFARPDLPVVAIGNIFDAPRRDYNIGEPMRLLVRSTPKVKAFVRRGIGIRIFSLQPTDQQLRDGSWVGSQPRNWNPRKPEDCLIYLSLVFRFDPAQLNQFVRSESINLGVLSSSAGWLSYSDGNRFRAGYYVLVVEGATTGDKPQFADRGESDAQYELIRLSSGTTKNYFGDGALYFKVAASGGGSVPDASFRRQIDALAAAAMTVSNGFHCYTAKPKALVQVDQPAAVALADSCGGGAAIATRGIVVGN
jgi:hypothetical protein